MKQSIHLFDPVCGKKSGSMFVTMRCGMVRKPEEIKSTTIAAEVTCIKCLNYINNPYRVLRKYGKVKVVESFFVVVWGDYGYKFDINAMIQVPGTWAVNIAYKNSLHLNLLIKANNMADLGFKLLDLYEQQIKELNKQN